jgi:hypothetical protein
MILMNRILLLITVLFISSAGITQSLNGQWKGAFDSNGDIVASGDNTTEYMLELNIDGKKITGYSYSYFNNKQFFVICSLLGTYNKTNKTLDVYETKRIKGATPPDWSDCLQEHLLAYRREGNTEVLTGTWKAVKGGSGDCGTGFTTLTRNTLTRKTLSTFNNTKDKEPATTSNKLKSHLTTTIVSPPVQQQSKGTNHAQANQKDSAKESVVTYPPAITVVPVPEQPKDTVIQVPPGINYQKRTNIILQTIEIEHTTFTVDLYDNGAIDGDSISLFYNDKVIIFHKRLSEKAISVTLTIDPAQKVNDLTMYAENLGEIPPNTALMVITDGKKRYEVNVSSDLTTSGSVRFILHDSSQ